MNAGLPSLSVVVPFHDAPELLERCLEGLARSSLGAEWILVDDASTDARSTELARDFARRGRGHLLRLERNRGPAAARNRGADAARGDVIVFVDADCVVHEDTLERIARAFSSDPELGAVFGSYDDRPAAPGVVSRYRNLLHHFTHQHGRREAGTFWAGCGACRAEVFRTFGRFDEGYDRPMIEDVELGMRWRAAGVRIHLEPEIQVTHLKRWRLVEMIRVDVTRRAIPWTRLLLERPVAGDDLNLKPEQRLCVALVFAALGTTAAAGAAALRTDLPAWIAVAAPAALLAPVLAINLPLYRLFHRAHGLAFALAGVGLHLLYYVYGGLGYLYARLTHRRAPIARVPAG